MVAPHALSAEEIAGVVAEYRHAAEVARDAGFDGVQLHCANGYLIDQFLRTGTNHRTDDFGGSIENRMRFPLQVVEALCDVWGPSRVGARISPTGGFNEMSDDDPLSHFTRFAEELDRAGIVYLEVIGKLFDQQEKDPQQDEIGRSLRSAFSRTYISNGDHDAGSARAAIESGAADLVSFGRPFIGNPDLPERLRTDAYLVEAGTETWYYTGEGGRADGYTDFSPVSAA